MRDSDFDVVVVGAGMFGSAAGKYLSKNLRKIAIVGPDESDSEQVAVSQQSFGAYYDQARITRRLGWDEIWGATDSRSMDRFRVIEAESGVEFFEEKGALVLLAKSIAHPTEQEQIVAQS